MVKKPTYEELEQRVIELEKEVEKGKQVGDALHQYEHIVSSSTDMLALLDKRFNYLAANKAYTEAFKLTPEQIIGNTVTDVFGEEFFNAVVEPHADLCLGGEEVNYQDWVEFPAHGRRYMDITYCPYYNEDNKITGFVVNGRNITKRKRAEEALQEKEAFIKSVLDNLPIGIAVNSVDPAVKFEYMNDNFTKFYRTTREALADPDAFWNAVYEEPDFREEMMKRVLDDCAGGVLEHMHWVDVPITRKGEKTSFITARNIPVPDKQLMISTVWDVTERKRTNEALRESEVRFKDLASFLPLSLFETDDQGNITYANHFAFESIGYTQEEIDKGLHMLQVIHPKDHDKAIKMSMQVMQGGHTDGSEYLVQRKDGSTFPAFINTRGSIKDDKPVGLKGYIFNLTEQKMAEEALRESEEKLRQSQKMESIGTLAGGIAHDFNNVLYSIIGYTELTMDDVPEGSLAQKNLKEVFKGAMRAKDMVQQILAFSRKADTQKKPIKVQSVLKEAIKLLRTSIPSTIEIRHNIDEDCSPALADSTQVHQVVMNLATNAYQAMRAKGGLLELTLMAEEIGSDDSELDLDPGAYLKLTVSDTGHGMANVVMEKIFDPYFSTKGPGEGTGMGLAVVHGIVKDHGGDIQVYSKLGEGSVFHVYLPLIETSPVEPKTISAEPTLTGTERILFVDDEEPLVFMAHQILERLGYQVTTRTSSVEALEAFRTKPDAFDLVITDMTMPNMTGVELTSRLKEIRADIPIIICTGFSEVMDKNRAKALGIRAYVMKPIVKEAIARTIRKVIDEGRVK